jgi:hypothetical protein
VTLIGKHRVSRVILKGRPREHRCERMTGPCLPVVSPGLSQESPLFLVVDEERGRKGEEIFLKNLRRREALRLRSVGESSCVG